MTSHPYEILVLGFDDVSLDTSRDLVPRMNATRQVRVVFAMAACRAVDGVTATMDWTDPATVSDLLAELTARHLLGFDDVSTDDLAAGLEPGTTVLVLLLEHLWADAVIADIRALGGRCLTSRMLPADPMHDTDC